MPNLKLLSRICGVLQMIGLLLICGAMLGLLPRFTWAVISVSGFAAVVKVFLPLPDHQDAVTTGAALAGVGIIIMSCIRIAIF